MTPPSETINLENIEIQTAISVGPRVRFGENVFFYALAWTNSEDLDPSRNVFYLRARCPKIQIWTPATWLEKL